MQGCICGSTACRSLVVAQSKKTGLLIFATGFLGVPWGFSRGSLGKPLFPQQSSRCGFVRKRKAVAKASSHAVEAQVANPQQLVWPPRTLACREPGPRLSDRFSVRSNMEHVAVADVDAVVEQAKHFVALQRPLGSSVSLVSVSRERQPKRSQTPYRQQPDR